MKRTIVYIDGYNLYYRLLRGTGDKWLDLYSFSKGLLNSDHDIIEVKYFTSMVVPYPYDAAAIERQNVYIQAVAANPKVRVILGYYSKKPAVLPARSANSTNRLPRTATPCAQRGGCAILQATQPPHLSAARHDVHIRRFSYFYDVREAILYGCRPVAAP